MKIAFDENIPPAMVRAFQAFATEKTLRRECGAFEVKSAKDYTPKRGDADYSPKNDVPWLKRFYLDGGRVVISGNTDMKNVPHERLALIEYGFIVIFFEAQWSRWKFFRKCALLLHWWPVIAKTVKRARPKSFYHIPSHWQEGKLRRVSNRDPRELKIERQKIAARKSKKANKQSSSAPAECHINPQFEFEFNATHPPDSAPQNATRDSQTVPTPQGHTSR